MRGVDQGLGRRLPGLFHVRDFLPLPVMPAKAASHFIHHACDGQLSAAPPCSSCLRRQASHFIRHVCDGASRQSKSFRLPAAAELLSLCVLKEKVTKEKEHPTWRLPGILPGKSVSRGRAFRAGILPARKGLAILGKARYAASSSPPHRRRGAPEKQARILCARRPWRHELVATFPHAFSLHLSLG